MNIEIKKSIKPVNYFDAINILESRLKDINDNKKKDLIWILEHSELYTAGTNFKVSIIVFSIILINFLISFFFLKSKTK